MWGVPVFERARQVGYLTGDDRHHVGLEVAALVEEGADRRDVGRVVSVPLAFEVATLAYECTDRGGIGNCPISMLAWAFHWDAVGHTPMPQLTAAMISSLAPAFLGASTTSSSKTWDVPGRAPQGHA
jgi:hypothetical protein